VQANARGKDASDGAGPLKADCNFRCPGARAGAALGASVQRLDQSVELSGRRLQSRRRQFVHHLCIAVPLGYRNGDSHIALEQPDNGPILEALGFTAIKRMDFAEAAQDYERAIAARPRSHVAHYNLAKVYLQLGNRARALEEAKAAADLNPSADYLGLVGQVEAAP
jgi:tetratricopeptide (TPR) repeat protein